MEIEEHLKKLLHTQNLGNIPKLSVSSLMRSVITCCNQHDPEDGNLGTTAQNRPIFTPLNSDPEQPEIRLLKVLPPSSDGKPSFQLRTASLTTEHKFAFVLYVWGQRSEKEIVLNGQAARISVGAVSPAIQTAMHHYKQVCGGDQENLWLWTDAICIDQSDEREKSSQVPLMARIFSRAEHVICCLTTSMPSLSAERFRAASKSLNQLARRLQTVDLVDKDNNLIALAPFNVRIINWVERFDGLNAALESLGPIFISEIEYWTRVWILQEVILPSNAIIARDRDRFDWWMLKLVSRWRTEVVRLPKPDFVSEESWETITSNNAAVFWDLIEVIAGSGLSEADKSTRRGAASSDTYSISRHDQQRHPELQNWLTSFQSAGTLRATDHRDHIYGLLAIAPIGIEVDYSQSIKDVYSSYVAAYLKDWNSCFQEELPQLYFLKYCRLGKNSEGYYAFRRKGHGIPSWVPNYPLSSEFRRIFGFKAIPAPFGYPSSSYKNIFPPETEPARVLLDFDANRLPVSGMVVKTFSETCSRANQGDEIRDVVRTIKLLNKDVPAVSVLVQTNAWEKLQQVSDPNARNLLLARWVDSCASMCRENNEDIYQDPSEAAQYISALRSIACESDDGVPAESFRHVLFLHTVGPSWKDRLFFADSGLLYLVGIREAVRRGDLLCILDGGSMPSILRPHSSYYINVCQAFVLGLENGQAIDYLRREDTNIQRFELI